MRLHVLKGQSYLQAMIDAGMTPNSPCGGNGTCGKCRILADGHEVLACLTTADCEKDVEVSEITDHHAQILEDVSSFFSDVGFAPAPMPADVAHPLLAAVDLGSTSVVVFLLDGLTGKQLGAASSLNPQRSYGADVVSRCSYVMEHGPEALYSCIRRTVAELLEKLVAQNEMDLNSIVRMVFVGNCGMHHLFLGLDVHTLALAPYNPIVKDLQRLKAAELGLPIHPEGEVIWLPNIGGFVGSDTVGCMIASDMDANAALTLMIDIGTNGEIVLGNRDRMITCSTAAGPAFEGAKITCGMRGAAGAIDRVSIENGRLSWHVIGNGEPKGICGSGLLDAVACLLELGLIDDSGRMEESYYFTESVFLCQKDIRELQLAKAAISAGILILCRELEVDVNDVERLFIAGAFGNYLDPVSACRIGMLPRGLLNRITPVGNAAGEGAIRAVINESQLERGCRLAREVQFVELALDPDFQDIYVDELSFE